MPPEPIPSATPPGVERRLRGLGLVFVAGALYASAGVFVRGLPFDGWTLLAWRSLAGAVFLIGLTAYESGRLSLRDYAFGPLRWLLVPVGALATICYIFALKITTVADVMIVYATMPFVTAAVAWLWVGEVPSRRTLVASTAALGGVLVMIGGGGAASGRSLVGTALILFMNVSFALLLVLARRDPQRSLTPVNAASLVLASLVSFCFAPAQPIPAGGLALLVLFGTVTIGLAMSMFMAGARLAPSSEAALVGISDVVLGPLMVWLVLGEQPSRAAMTGGAVVAAALLWNIWPEVQRAASPSRARARRVSFDKARHCPD